MAMHSRMLPFHRLCKPSASSKMRDQAPSARFLSASSIQQGLAGAKEKVPREDGSEGTSTEKVGEEVRRNHFDIQMLPQHLREVLFGRRAQGVNLSNIVSIMQAQKELRTKFKLTAKSETLEYPDVKLPPLEGANVAEHFLKIGRDQCHPYIQFADELAKLDKIPPMPKQWKFEAGWIKYSDDDPEGKPIEFPDEKVLVFDVEVWMEATNMPVLAVALSPTAWYAWTSEVRY